MYLTTIYVSKYGLLISSNSMKINKIETRRNYDKLYVET
jgi:hypothetical protein